MRFWVIWRRTRVTDNRSTSMSVNDLNVTSPDNVKIIIIDHSGSKNKDMIITEKFSSDLSVALVIRRLIKKRVLKKRRDC